MFHSFPFQFLFSLAILCFSSSGGFAQSDVLPQKFEIVFRTEGEKTEDKKVLCLSPSGVQSAINDVLSGFQNNGFPFAQALTDTLEYLPEARFVVTIKHGPAIVNGELVLHGDSFVHVSTIRNWLRFKKNAPFSNRRFSRIPFLSAHLPFAEEFSMPQLEWFGNQAVVHLYLRKRKINSFSGIVGILPQPNGGGAIITGNVDGDIANLFRRGISLNFKWMRFAASSQTASIVLKAPSLASNGLGMESTFELFRQDSLINKQKMEILGTNSNAGLLEFRFGVLVSNASGSLASRDQDVQSIGNNALVFGLRYEPDPPQILKTDRKSFFLQMAPSIKTIRRKTGNQSMPQMELLVRGEFPVYRPNGRFSVQNAFQSGFLASSQITTPDQYRVGGSKSFRGFNENSFFTSQHFLYTVQPMYRIDRNFIGGAFAEAMVFNPERSATIFSSVQLAASVGIVAEIEAGNNLIRISLANGFSKSLPFDYQTTKIHFGYVARF